MRTEDLQPRDVIIAGRSIPTVSILNPHSSVLNPRSSVLDHSHARDLVSLQYPVYYVHPLHNLREHGVVPIQTKVVLEVDEPLRVAGVVPARAHADGAAHMWHGAQLVTQVLRESDVFVRAGAQPLHHEIVLDAV